MARRSRQSSLDTEPERFDYNEIAVGYARDAVAGRIVVCKWVRLACARHLRDLARTDWPYVFRPESGNDICGFAEKLPHVEGRWSTSNVRLEPWQMFLLCVIFGWRRKDDKGRRFRKTYNELARKQGKSTLAAIVALYCLTCENEPAPYVLIGATTGAQAQKVFHPAKMIVTRTPDLQVEYGLQVWARSISEPSGGYIQTINSKGSTQDGHNPHLGVLDELHAHATRELYDVIDSAFGARRNPLLWIITTAGFDTNGVCYEQRKFITQVLEGVIEADHYFGIIYTLDEGDDPLDPACWIKSNPNLGVSVQIANMEAAALEAKAQPGKMPEFMTKRLNVWTSARGGHFDMLKWKTCDRPVDLAALKSVPCWGGFDLSAVSDFTSFRLVWWLDGTLYTWGTRYLPEAAVRPRTERNNVPYTRWTQTEFMGRPLITVTPGDVVDYAWIEKDIRAALADFNVKAIGFDSWHAQDLVNRLMADGAPLVEVRQGHASLSGPMKELDRLYLSGTLAHGGDEVLAWCASNVVTRADHNGNLVPSKRDSGEKIDDIAALLNALAVASSEIGGASVYETRGLLVFGA